MILDNYYASNFSTSFLNTNESILINLLIWQYWWWFWFSLFIVFYYLILFKYITKRFIFSHPKIMTSKKAHGRWGDYISGLVPVFWCFNILVNSNFLLKLNEWQTESSLFTLRIRGKQWFWVYKMNPNWEDKVNKFTYHVGHDKSLNLESGKQHKTWSKFTFEKKYFGLFEAKIKDAFINDNLVLSNRSYKNHSVNCTLTKTTPLVNVTDVNFKTKPVLDKNQKNFNVLKHQNYEYNNILSIFSDQSLFKKKNMKIKYYKFPVNVQIDLNFMATTTNKNYIFIPTKEQNQPYRRFWLTLKQKPVKNYPKVLKKLTSFHPNLKYYDNLNKKTNFFLKNKTRLLKTDTILYLPSSYRITVVTNSFDVVHSWFVPGLGIKMDCVPGRSTHHSMKFHKTGFYYGQCAEICGRFHHHMPINIVIIEMNLFLIFWNAHEGWEI